MLIREEDYSVSRTIMLIPTGTSVGHTDCDAGEGLVPRRRQPFDYRLHVQWSSGETALLGGRRLAGAPLLALQVERLTGTGADRARLEAVVAFASNREGIQADHGAIGRGTGRGRRSPRGRRAGAGRGPGPAGAPSGPGRSGRSPRRTSRRR